MPLRILPLVNSEYYHVYNRGVAQMPVFVTEWDYKRFVNTISYYRLDNIKQRF